MVQPQTRWLWYYSLDSGVSSWEYTVARFLKLPEQVNFNRTGEEDTMIVSREIG